MLRSEEKGAPCQWKILLLISHPYFDNKIEHTNTGYIFLKLHDILKNLKMPSYV